MSVYGSIAVYVRYCVFCLKIYYILRCLQEYIYKYSIFTIKTPRALLVALAPLNLLIVKILTNVTISYNIFHF